MTLSQTRTKTVLHQFRHSIHCKSQEKLGKKNTKQESRFWCHSSKNYKLWHCSLLQEYASPLAINNILVHVCSYGVVLCCYLTWLQHFSCISGLSPWVSGGPSGPWDTCVSEPTQPHALRAAGVPSAHWQPAATAGLTAGTPSEPVPSALHAPTHGNQTEALWGRLCCNPHWQMGKQDRGRLSDRPSNKQAGRGRVRTQSQTGSRHNDCALMSLSGKHTHLDNLPN